MCNVSGNLHTFRTRAAIADMVGFYAQLPKDTSSTHCAASGITDTTRLLLFPLETLLLGAVEKVCLLLFRLEQINDSQWDSLISRSEPDKLKIKKVHAYQTASSVICCEGLNMQQWP